MVHTNFLVELLDEINILMPLFWAPIWLIDVGYPRLTYYGNVGNLLL